MSIQINKSAYEKLIKEDIEWLLSNTKDSLERRHIVEVLNYSPERLYASGSSEIPKDLEEAAKAYADDTNPTDSFYEAFKAGAKWQKEQMMKEAVEAKIYGYDDGSFELIASWLDMPNNSIYKDGDKVRIIIVKEEGK